MFKDLLFRLRSLFRRNSVESETDLELRFHFEQQVEKNLRSGLTRQEAMRQARLDFGGHEQLKEECREARGANLIESFFQDIRYALRVLARTPVITCVAVLSLALGIGANTAIFSLIDGVMLRMLPVQKPEELMQVVIHRPWDPEISPDFTNPLWEELRNRQDVFADVFAWGPHQFDLARGGAVQSADGLFASGDYFTALGIAPAAGRLLTPADDVRGCAGVAVLSYGFWQAHFGGTQSTIGSTISLDNRLYEIVGVSAPEFDGVLVGQKFDVAIPICAAAQFDGARSRLDQRSWWWLNVMGRRKPGISVDQVEARLKAMSPAAFAPALPQNYEPQDQQKFLKRTFGAIPAATGVSYLRQEFRQPLAILMGVVGLVLLIACANIASLMLARAAARHREIAVRKALGASRSRLIRQLLTECVLLSVGGALLGVVFARWGSALLVQYISTKDNQVFLDLALDWRALSFTAGVAIFTGLLFGVLPAFRSTRVSLTAAMKGAQTANPESRTGFRLGKWIVASQVALSLVLLVASGLFLRSLVKLVTMDVGFDKNNVLIAHANLQTAKVPPERQAAMFEDIEGRLRAVPGVISVGRSIMTPVSEYIWNNSIEPDTPNPPTGDDALVYFNFVSPGYFGTLRTPLLAGRNFNGGDTKTSAHVAVINETLARRFFPGVNPLGRHFRIEEDPGKPRPLVEVVGLVKDSKYESLREKTDATAFFPITQVPEHAEEQAFEIRTAARPSALIT
ncbi:MAG TPA: ABC transporter permease, partial [Candidatus Angelobacter sp.]|nr:ABC transporter permease [Candidatus Angelobacter sp.]